MAPFVLIVDDEPAIRQLLSDFLGFEGYEVAVAENGRQALNVIERTLPNLVLLDLNMPELDGQGFLQELARRELRLPVLIMTAGLAGRQTAERYGAVGCLSKPFDLDELLTLLRYIWEPEHRVTTYYCDFPGYSLSVG